MQTHQFKNDRRFADLFLEKPNSAILCKLICANSAESENLFYNLRICGEKSMCSPGHSIYLPLFLIKFQTFSLKLALLIPVNLSNTLK
jgi:hypothetical protein